MQETTFCLPFSLLHAHTSCCLCDYILLVEVCFNLGEAVQTALPADISLQLSDFSLANRSTLVILPMRSLVGIEC